MQYRIATDKDVDLLANLNQQLVNDERHRNRMTLDALRSRMESFLQDAYRAVVFEESNDVCGYALYRVDPEYVYLRQFLILPQFRRQGLGREAIELLRTSVWNDQLRVRIDVLCDNEAGIAFWRSLGFSDYCLTMEIES